MITTTGATEPVIRAIAAALTTASAPDRSTRSAVAVSSSRTTTGKTLAASSTGWATKANTNMHIAKATSAVTAGLTATTTAAAIVMTTAIATATTGAKQSV